MTASKWLFTDEYITKIHAGVYVFASHTFKCALFKSTTNLSASSTTYSGLTNETDGIHGYTTGGATLTGLALSGTTTVKVTCDDISWTASGGSITARYAVIYDSTANRIVCYCLLDTTPADVTAGDGDPFLIQINANGIYTAAQVP